MGEGARAGPDWQPDALLDLLQDRKVVLLDEAVRLTELAAEKIETFAKLHSDRICFFGGNHPVVCLAVATRSA
jgi:hypothetical protein